MLFHAKLVFIFKGSHENLKKLFYSLLAYVLKSKEKKSFRGALRINTPENVTFINISISKDYKIMRCGNKKTFGVILKFLLLLKD